MQTGWRLERTYLAGAGYPESRLEGLDINWSDPFEPTGHAALWADNGTGKTTITALRFALYLPPSSGLRPRRLRPVTFPTGVLQDASATSWNRPPARSTANCSARDRHGRRLARGGTQDRDNPETLHRDFYGWVTGPDGPDHQRAAVPDRGGPVGHPRPVHGRVGHWCPRRGAAAPLAVRPSGPVEHVADRPPRGSRPRSVSRRP